MSEQLKFYKGLEKDLPTSGIEIGALYHCTDTGNTYRGISTTKMELFSNTIGFTQLNNDNTIGGVVINQGDANGKYSIAGGSNDKELFRDIFGSTAMAFVPDIEESKADGNLSISYGAGNVAVAPAANAIGLKNQAGCLGYYITAISSDRKTLTLSSSQSSTVKPTTSILNKWKKDFWVYIVVNGIPYAKCGIISSTNTTNGTVTMQEVLPFSAVNKENNEMPHDRSIIAIPPIEKEGFSFLGLTFDTFRSLTSGEVDFGIGSNTFGFDNITNGIGSAAFGMHNVAAGNNALVSGRENIGNHAALVGGLRNEATGQESFASGRDNVASGDQSHAEGKNTIASGHISHTEGYGSKATSYHSHAEGKNTEANGESSHAEGTGSKANGNHSHAEGMNTIASASCSHAEGKESKAQSYHAHAEGKLTEANGESSHAEGVETVAEGLGSHAEGYGTYTDLGAKYSHVEGYNTRAIAPYQHVSGKYNKEDANALFIIGNGTGENDRRNIVSIYEDKMEIGGVNSDEYLDYKVSISKNQIEILNDESARNAVFYDDLISLNDNGLDHFTTLSTEELTINTGEYGTSVTLNPDSLKFTQMNLDDTTIEETSLTYSDILKLHTLEPGDYTTVGQKAGIDHGKYATAEGLDNNASGNYSHAEGYQTTASGIYSHAEGYQTTASINQAHAEGSGAIASGKQSHAEGVYTKATNKAQHVQGRYNIPETKTSNPDNYGTYAHIVGNGTSSAPSNAHTLDWDGNAWYAGNVALNGGIVLKEGSGFGTENQMNAIQDPKEGQIFFVLL